MNDAAGATSFLIWALAIGGAVGMVGATVAAARGRPDSVEEGSDAEAASRDSGFAWIVIAGLSYAILALAAVMRSPDSDGLRAAVVQLGATFLAAALGVVSLGGSSSDDRSGSRLASLGIFVAWLSLLGLPPTLGFHGKLLVYQSLFQADWGWLAVAAMAGTAGALVPAFRALAAPARRDVTKSRAILIALLVSAVALLGVYPQTALSVTALLTGSG